MSSDHNWSSDDTIGETRLKQEVERLRAEVRRLEATIRRVRGALEACGEDLARFDGNRAREGIGWIVVEAVRELADAIEPGQDAGPVSSP